MTKYSINPYIFPQVMTIHIDSPTPNSIDLPKGANLLYLQALSDPDEKYLFRKYANKEHFSDEVVLCQDLVQVKMRFSSSQPASCNSSC